MAFLFSAPRHGVALPARPPSPDPHAARQPRAGSEVGALASGAEREVDDDVEAIAKLEGTAYVAELKGTSWRTIADAKAQIIQIEHIRSACALKGDPAVRGGKTARLLCSGAPDCKVFYGLHKSRDGQFRVGNANVLHESCSAQNTPGLKALAGLGVLRAAVLADPVRRCRGR